MGKRVDDIFEALLLDKEELLDGIKKGNSSSKSFLACVDECVCERESKDFGGEWILKQSYILGWLSLVGQGSCKSCSDQTEVM